MATRAPVQRHDDEPAFVLHAYPYRETSMIVEAFTPGHGRIAMVARVPSVRVRKRAACCRPSSR